MRTIYSAYSAIMPLYLPLDEKSPGKSSDYLDGKDVCKKLRCGRTHLYNISDPKHSAYIPDFPDFFYPGNSNSRHWLAHEIEEWMAAQAAKPLRRIKRRGN